MSHSAETISVTSSGYDVNGTADKFTFVYRPVTGNATVIAKLSSLQAVDPWAQAGVMIRESLTASARHGVVMTTSGNGTQFRRRTTASGTTLQTAAFGGAAGGGQVNASWLKLQRTGTTLAASWSTDGVTWMSISTASITLPTTAYVGIAVASHAAGATTAVMSNVWVVGSGTLDGGMSAADIGAPILSGGSWGQAGVYTLDGAGAGIASTSDQFRFVSKLMSGDMDIVTRVAQFEVITGNARAGVMLRSSTSASSAHHSILVGSQGVQLVTRAAALGTTTSTNAGQQTAPVWLKVSRRSSTLTFLTSNDGVSWTQVGDRTASGSYYVGLAVTSADVSRLARVRFENVTVGAPAPNQPPAVSLTTPVSSVTISTSATLAVAARATDADGSITAVDFYANSTLLGTDTTAPYEATFTSGSLGLYTLKAVARDNNGAATTSATQLVTVIALVNQPPVVSLISPVDEARVFSPATMTIQASASDADGGVQRVDFYSSQTLLGSDLTAPYVFAWTGMPDGIYAIKVVAYDAQGLMAVSATHDVLVAKSSLPSRAIFTPATNHDTLIRYDLEILASVAGGTSMQTVLTTPLGVPPVVDGEVEVDVAPLVFTLPPGVYVAVVSAVSSDGTLRSAPSPAFFR